MSRDHSYFSRLKGKQRRLKPRADDHAERGPQQLKANPPPDFTIHGLIPAFAAVGPSAEF